MKTITTPNRIFTELVRRNAFISRVIVEVSWLAILWLMNIGKSSPDIHFSPINQLIYKSRSSGPHCPFWRNSLLSRWFVYAVNSTFLLLLTSTLGNQPQAACSSSLALLTFSWLNTIASTSTTYQTKLLYICVCSAFNSARISAMSSYLRCVSRTR